MTAEVHVLNPANDILDAHQGLDKMAAEYAGEPASVLIIMYSPGNLPSMRYYGRTLNTTELMGILARLSYDLARSSSDG